MNLKKFVGHQKILVFIDGYIPTSKAYGVTVRETVSILSKMNFQIRLSCIKSEYHDQDFDEILNLIINQNETPFSKSLRKFAQQGYNLPHVLAWQISCALRLRASKKQIFAFNPHIIWTRDRFLPRSILNHLNGTINVVEFHEHINNQTIQRAHTLGPSKVILAPISPSIRESIELALPNFVIVDAPMGIRFDLTEFKSNVKKTLSKKRIINVGYFGKISPQGYSKGIEDFLNLIKQTKQVSKEANFKFQINGFLRSEERELKNLIARCGLAESDVTLTGHLPHGESLKNMKACDIFFLPSARSNKYVGFPLKALEYFYFGGRIIAADTKVNRDIFRTNQQPAWYRQGDSKSAYHALLSCLKREFSNEEIANMSLFIEQFSWEQRTKSILDQTESLFKNRFFNK